MFYYSFTLKLPVKQHLSDFSPLKSGKTMLISPRLQNSPYFCVFKTLTLTLY